MLKLRTWLTPIAYEVCDFIPKKGCITVMFVVYFTIKLRLSDRQATSPTLVRACPTRKESTRLSTETSGCIMEQTKTCQGTWKASLKLLLNQLETESGRSPKIAILGIGNLVAGALSRCRCAKETERVLVIAAGPAPENSTGELRAFAPDLVLFVDAADMGEDPEAVELALANN